MSSDLFIIKPGETIVGFGVDFGAYLLTGETISTVTVTCDNEDVNISQIGSVGTDAVANVAVPEGQMDGTFIVTYTAVGSMGSVRKSHRVCQIRTNSK